jgi:NADPH:quinone reductase-like Zn-dependent oxidoreductase
MAGPVAAGPGRRLAARPGDEVYANLLEHGYGGFAEYVSVPVKVLSLKPANLSFEEAAAVPMAGSPPCTRVWAAAAPQALVAGQLRAAPLARKSPHSQDRRLQAEVARPSALLRLRIT